LINVFPRSLVFRLAVSLSVERLYGTSLIPFFLVPFGGGVVPFGGGLVPFDGGLVPFDGGLVPSVGGIWTTFVGVVICDWIKKNRGWLACGWLAV
jgi:hypothetical protein